MCMIFQRFFKEIRTILNTGVFTTELVGKLSFIQKEECLHVKKYLTLNCLWNQHGIVYEEHRT